MKESYVSHNFNHPENVPFKMLTPREQDVLQYVADGFTHEEQADALGISEKTVEHHIRGVAKIGMDKTSDPQISSSVVLTALIYDGIMNNYINHELDTELQTPLTLTARQDEYMKGLLQGKRVKGIADSLQISTKTVEIHSRNVSKRLGAKSFYHKIARYAYLQKHGLIQVKNRKENA